MSSGQLQNQLRLWLLSLLFCLSYVGRTQSMYNGAAGAKPEIQGPDQLNASDVGHYQALHVSWSPQYFWRVVGADSIAGISQTDYADDSMFYAPAQITIFWDDSVANGKALIQLIHRNTEDKAELVTEMVVALNSSATCSYYLVGDGLYGQNPRYGIATTRRDEPIYVCGDGNDRWVFSNGPNQWEFHRWEVYYYTENGGRYKETWRELHPHYGTTWAAQSFYVTWYQTVPDLVADPRGNGVSGLTYPSDNDLDQPDYTLNGAFAGAGSTYLNCRPGDRIVWAQLYSSSSGASSGFSCYLTSSKNLTCDVYYGVQPLSAVSLTNAPAALCTGQHYTVSTTRTSTFATQYEFQWRDENTGQVIGLTQQFPAAQVMVPYTFFPSVRYRVQVNLPLPVEAAGHTVRMYVRPVRKNGSGWGCDGVGPWTVTGTYYVNPRADMKPGLTFTNLPVVHQVQNTMQVNAAPGATTYQFQAFKYAGSVPNPISIFQNGSTQTTSAASVAVNFPSDGKYLIVVTASGPCGAGTAQATELTIGGTAVSPRVAPNAWYEFGVVSLTCGLGGDTYLLYTHPDPNFETKLNPAWNYTVTGVVGPGGYRTVSGQWYTELSDNRARIELSLFGPVLPVAYRYDVLLQTDAGNGSVVTQAYEVSDALCRPAGGGNGGNSGSVAKAQISVYPNPATTNELTVEAASGNCQWAKLYDQQGVLVKEVQAGQEASAKLVMPLDRLPSGIYLLRVFDGQQMLTTRISR